jgi:thiol:disulfide interchange protein
MNTRIVLVFGLFATTCLLTAWGAEAPTQSFRPAIYDESADGAKQIAAALEVAQSKNKRVLLQFGANWCGWCHKLHGLFESDPGIAAALKESFVVVLVDVNKGHNTETDKQYGHPTAHGLPVIVILDSNGKQLVTKDTGELEEGDHHSPQKVLSFLKEWAGKKV